MALQWQVKWQKLLSYSWPLPNPLSRLAEGLFNNRVI